MNAKKTNTTTTNKTKARHMAAATEAVRNRLGLETLEDRKRDALDFHDISVGSIRDIIALAFEAGFAAGSGAPAPFKYDPADPGAMLDTLEITKKTGRPTGGTWVKGNIAGHAFEALVFPEHATDEAFEMGDSRISKFWLQEHFTHTEVACFDRGWDRKPTTDAARAITDLLTAGLAETVFGK
ncbi:MAG: hypothetical protein HUU19_01515 [Phycisphaerales bacterium]|nr:hypothetical protein [Phycisphaerales bacterium]